MATTLRNGMSMIEQRGNLVFATWLGVECPFPYITARLDAACGTYAERRFVSWSAARDDFHARAKDPTARASRRSREA